MEGVAAVIGIVLLMILLEPVYKLFLLMRLLVAIKQPTFKEKYYTRSNI